MRTHLGAATELRSVGQMPPGWDAGGVSLLHCEGYCLYRPEAAAAAMRRARELGALVSIDLASFETVRNCIGPLRAVLEEGLVDIVFSNEQEAEQLADIVGSTGDHPLHPRDQVATQEVHRAQQMLLKYCKVGEEGGCRLSSLGATIAAPCGAGVSGEHGGSGVCGPKPDWRGRSRTGRASGCSGHHGGGGPVHGRVPTRLPAGGAARPVLRGRVRRRRRGCAGPWSRAA